MENNQLAVELQPAFISGNKQNKKNVLKDVSIKTQV